MSTDKKSNAKKISILTLVMVVVLILLSLYVNPFLNTFTAKTINSFVSGLIPTVEYYENNKLSKNGFVNFNNDVKEIQTTSNKRTLINHTDAYSLSFPVDTTFDFEFDQIKIMAKSSDIEYVITREMSPYDDVPKYISEYTNRYLLDPLYLAKNNVTLHKNQFEKINGYNVQVIFFSRNAPSNSNVANNTYSQCYIYTNTRLFYRISAKTDVYDAAFINDVYLSLNSFSEAVFREGTSKIYKDYHPTPNKQWNTETKKVYESISNANDVTWGIYCPQSIIVDAINRVTDVEQKIDNKFGVVLEYIYFGDPFPTVGMTHAYEQGKLVEFTMQVSTVMNENLNGYNPFFSVLDGAKDEYIHEFAKSVKAFGHPFMFRLNNEMNSDWVSYGGPATLNDPELYKEVWIKIYKIFEEEGVDNVIWIFNPNDRNYPPNNYNHFLNYYPGNEYVQMFGVTGYNTGDYYYEISMEEWREFKDIYDSVYAECSPYFSKFPWIITEFASSSFGGDKPGWIRRMFDNINNYPNIKIAVWFNACDWDFRPEKKGIIARPYFLTENQDTINAFRDSLKKNNYQNKSFFTR